MDRSSIIAAVSSPPGRSLRGLVRVSGPGALEVLDRIVASVRGGPRPPPSSDAAPVRGLPGALDGGWRRGVWCARLRIPAPGMACIVLVMPGPRSATGDDSFELLLPGNPRLLELVIDELISMDPRVRRAEAGEFTARAFLNGRLSLDEAEGVAALISATSDAELAAAARLADGALGAMSRGWAARLAELAALVEAGIDFTDEEDVVAIPPVALAAQAEEVEREIESLAGAGSAARAVATRPRVVLAGAPNAGKSSLFNALVRSRRTVESEVPGTTRDAIEAAWPLQAPGGRIDAILVDLPGLEAEGDSALSSRLRGAAERAIREADLVLLCRAADEDERGAARAEEVAALIGDRPRLLVHTKCDRAARADDGDAALRTSVVTGEGLEALRRAAARSLGERAPAQAGALAVLPRHRAALERAAGALREAAAHARRERPQGPWRAPEESAALLRLALDSLGEITGATHADEILGLVFSRFCIGK